MRLLQIQKEQQIVKLKGFFMRCFIVATTIVVICMGHVYGAMAILIISSKVYKEVMKEKKKEDIISRPIFF